MKTEKKIRSCLFIVFIFGYFGGLFSQPITLDSLKKLLYIPPVDTHYQLLRSPERFNKKEGIDTLKIFYKKQEATVIRHISNFYKRKIQVLDNISNILQEIYFDTVNVSAIERDGNGTIISTYTYKNGIGTAVDYYKTGITEKIWIFDEKNNHIISETGFDSIGRINGGTQYFEKDSIIQWNGYYPETGIKSHESYFGNKVMPWRSWYPDGSLMIDGTGFGILPNSYVGRYREFYPNGSLKQEAYYDEKIPNYRIGTWKWWDEKGNLIKQAVYKNNELIDKKEFLPKGKEKEK